MESPSPGSERISVSEYSQLMQRVNVFLFSHPMFNGGRLRNEISTDSGDDEYPVLRISRQVFSGGGWGGHERTPVYWFKVSNRERELATMISSFSDLANLSDPEGLRIIRIVRDRVATPEE